MTQLGRHLIIEMFEAENLNDAEVLEDALKETVCASMSVICALRRRCDFAMPSSSR